MSNNFKFTYTDLNELMSNLPQCTVGDVKQEVARAMVTGSADPTFGGVTFSIESGLTCMIEAFNAESDTDKDEVFGKPVSEDGARHELGLDPILVHDPAKAWLKYSARVSLFTEASADVDAMNFEVDSQSKVVLADYRKHTPETPVIDAIRDDQPPRSMLSIRDIQSIRPGDALLYAVRGTLKAGVKMTWGDVFSGTLNNLTKLLQNCELMKIKTELGATAEVNISIADDFRVIVTNTGNGRLRLAVKKANIREWATGAKVGVTISFADPDTMKEILINAILAVAGSSIEEINDLFDAANPSDWDPRILDILKELDLMRYIEDIEELKKQWNALLDSIYKTVEEVATARLEAGLNCNYQRITEDESVLEITMPIPDVTMIHSDIMTCNLKDILAYADSAPHHVTIERYLRQTSVETRFSWGFSLGIADFSMGGKDLTQKQWVTRTKYEDRSQLKSMSFLGSRGYTSWMLGERSGWTVDFSADMPQWVPTPSTKDYKYGLSLSWILHDNDVKNEELLAYLDYALIFGAVRRVDRSAVMEALTPNDTPLESMKMIVDLRFSHTQLLKMLAVPNETWLELMIGSMAKAMPYTDRVEMRSQPLKRQAFYRHMWKKYFEDRKCTFYEVKQYGRDELKMLKRDPHKVGKYVFGDPDRVYQNPISFAGQVAYHGKTGSNYSGIVRSWEMFSKGLRDLNEAMNASNGPRMLEDIFEALCAYFNQYLYVRAAGIFLIELARAAGIENADIDSTLKVTAKNMEFQFRSLHH